MSRNDGGQTSSASQPEQGRLPQVNTAVNSRDFGIARSSQLQQPHAHQHSVSSLSPRTAPALSDPDYYPDRDGEDDVFSNPDTAELEARSDATGATSPDRAHSPLFHSGSPTSRERSPPAWSFDEDQACPPEIEEPSGSLLGLLHHQPSLTSQLTDKPAENTNQQQRDSSAQQQDSRSTPTPSTLINTPQKRYASPLLASTALSRSGSIQRSPLLVDNNTALPPANELPSDPTEASHIFSLFAHQPASPADAAESPMPPGSPTASAIRPALGRSHDTSAAPSAPVSPASERKGFHWTQKDTPTTQQAGQARVVTRPSSPERQKTIMPSMIRSNAPEGLGLSTSGSAASMRDAPPASVRESDAIGSALTTAPSKDANMSFASAAEESSIFERDIEHRDARHVLSKSEALDVAIPPVLDDAVEALTDSNEQPIEIVAPLSSVTPGALPLSAMALSASSHSLDSAPASSGPQSSSSPPMSFKEATFSSGPPLDDPPPGSIAAQIAERLAPSPSRHRPTQSSGGSSISSSPRGRSPGGAAPMGVQQVLDGSHAGKGGFVAPISPPRAIDTQNAREASPNPDVGSRIHGEPGTPAGKSFAAASTAASGTHASGQPPMISSSAGSMAPGTASSFPALPLPNPFRSEIPPVLRSHHSPSASFSGPPGSDVGSSSGHKASMSMSLDGAIIPSPESAIQELSLDSMADAIAETTSFSQDTQASPSPIIPRRSGAFASAAARSSPVAPPTHAFQRRDTAATITPEKSKSNVVDMSAKQSERSATTGGVPGGNPARRLSFFSYANIINDTPAEVVDLDQSIQRTMKEETAHHETSLGGPAAVSLSGSASPSMNLSARH